MKCNKLVTMFLSLCFVLRRSVELSSNSLDSYENIMQSSLGFVNPGVVEFLLEKLGIDESNPPSLMRGLQRYSKSVLFSWVVRRMVLSLSCKAEGHI